METVTQNPTGFTSAELAGADLDELLANAGPGLRAALERSLAPADEDGNAGGGFNSFVDADR
jgi:hypothetical protein